jgi:PAS domain S-box-containing protein
LSDRLAVTCADFIRNIGHWQAEALRRPISITHHGRERLVLAAPDLFQAAQNGKCDPALRSDIDAQRSDYLAMLAHIDEGFLAFDTNMQIVACNAIAETFLGRAAEQLAGSTALDALPQPLASIVADRLQRVLRSRKLETAEASTFDGRRLSLRIFPAVAGAALLFTNVTEQHVLRRHLEEGEALAAAVRHHTRAAAIKLDTRARIEAIDDTFCTAFGFARNDVIGHRFVDLVATQQRRDAGELIELVMREHAPHERALTLLGKRGEELPGILSVAPILTDFAAHGVLALWMNDAATQVATLA